MSNSRGDKNIKRNKDKIKSSNLFNIVYLIIFLNYFKNLNLINNIIKLGKFIYENSANDFSKNDENFVLKLSELNF